MKHFEEILRTVGFSSVELIEEQPQWDFWRAEFKTPISTQVTNYLYLKTKATLKDATAEVINKWTVLSKTGKYTIIVPPKSPLSVNSAQTTHAFRGESCTTSRKFLLENISSSLEVRKLDNDPYFIDPTLELYDGNNIHGATTALAEWMLGKSKLPKFNRNVAVLRAHGGVGKTTLARALCNRIRKLDSTAIPILIESSHWSMYLQSDLQLRTVWDIAISQTFDRPSRLLSNETALRVLIREGIFVPIFDGFDELCLAPSSRIRPEDLLNEITEMLEADEDTKDARILLTSRETFWSSIEDKIQPDKVELFRLSGFSTEQRKQYFGLRLNDHAKRDLASRIASQIGGKIYESLDTSGQNILRPSGVPFILDLIVNYIDGNDDVKEINPYETDPLARLLESICVRENIRQSLNIPVSKQLEFFEEIFRDYPEEIPASAIAMYLEAICEIKDPSVITRFHSHVFLCAKSPDKFGARYEILRVYFLAKFLAGRLRDLAEGKGQLAFMNTVVREVDNSSEVADWLVGHLTRMDRPVVIEAFKHARHLITEMDAPEIKLKSIGALVNLALRLTQAVGKTDRSKELFDLLTDKSPKPILKSLVFCGSIKNFEFEKTQFNQCLFKDVEFSNCSFNSETSFIGCSFEGNIEFNKTQGFESSTFETPLYLSEVAELAIDKARGKISRIQVRERFAHDAVACALKKFKGQFGFSSLQFRRRLSGFPKSNPYAAEVWQALEDHGVISRHMISGVSEGGINLIDDPLIRREVWAFLDNGVIGNRLRACIQQLTKV